MANNFFKTDDYKKIRRLAKVLGFAFAKVVESEALFRKEDPELFFVITNDGYCEIYKNYCLLAEGDFSSLKSLVSLSIGSKYETMEEWLSYLVKNIERYKERTKKRLEAAQKEYSELCSLEVSLTRSLHDLRKTEKIIKEGHQ